MAKGDDSVMKKKNKANRKKLSRKNDSSSVSARVAAIIAAKKRRKSGKRRQCQGMCFSLPSLEDPFNDRNGKKKVKSKNDVKPTHDKDQNMLVNGQNEMKSNDLELGSKVRDVKNVHNRVIEATDGQFSKQPSYDVRKKNIQDHKKKGSHQKGETIEGSKCSPSKFLIVCLNSIENTLQHDDDSMKKEGEPLFLNSWGVLFWKYYCTGKDMMVNGNWSNVEKIAWVVSCAADTIAMKEKKGVSFSSPFLLYIVSSQENAIKVRAICKPLKPLGIHTVSIHPGATLNHQIQGLRSCEPEFLVSTPERLLQLLSLKAVDLSGVSLLVVDDLNLATDTPYVNMIKSIKKSTSKIPRTVVFNHIISGTSNAMLNDLLMGSVCRVSLNNQNGGLS